MKLGKNGESGFNLVELMVAIAIIGILSSHSISTYQKVTKTAAGYAQIKTMARQVASAREAIGNGDLVVAEITGHSCSACVCGYNGPAAAPGTQTWAPSADCMTHLKPIWKALGWENIPMSPFGHPILIDENESDGAPWNAKDWLAFWIPHEKRFGFVDVEQLKFQGSNITTSKKFWGYQ
jgi:prepilin-type N-terminal cleavage/methylation domain-containing protein